MSWLSVVEVNDKIDQLAGMQLARWPVSGYNPEKFLLGQSVTNKTGKGAKGAYEQKSSFEINALKIPSRSPGVPHPYGGTIDHLSVIITGGVLGNELIGPDAALHFAELFLNAVQPYQANDSVQKTTYHPGLDVPLGNFTARHGDLEMILDTLDIWVVPLVNPGGRDIQLRKGLPAQDQDLGRTNPRGVCINRNFDIGWHFKNLFSYNGDNQGWSKFLISTEPNRDDPNSAKNDYQGPYPHSELETRALVDLIVGGPSGDISITWLFDIHGQMADHCKVSYPWSWAQNQTKTSRMCLLNALHNPPGKAGAVVRNGYVASTVNPNAYEEYVPPETSRQLHLLATGFTNAAMTGGAPKPRFWKAPGQGGPLYPCVGAIDDYFLWLDRNHCRAFTIECEDLQPNDTIREIEMRQVAAGLFAAITEIAALVKRSTDPLNELSRLSQNQLKCP